MAAYTTRTTFTVTAEAADAKRQAEREDRKQKRKGFELVSHKVEQGEDGRETHTLEYSRPMRPLTPKEQATMDEFKRRFPEQG